MTDLLKMALIQAVTHLPDSTINSIAGRLSTAVVLDGVTANSIACAPATPQARHILSTLFADWRREMGDDSARALAAVLETAASIRGSMSDALRVESVWSGPADLPILDRKSMQAMFDIIDAARQELLISSYVVHDIGSTVARLRAASARGVRVTMVVEADRQHGGTLDYSGLHAAGLHGIPRLKLYYWPLEQRHIVDGKHGILHAKCIIGDRNDALISSANLTEHAFHRNIELGVRVTGGLVPAGIVRQFEELIVQGVLREHASIIQTSES